MNDKKITALKDLLNETDNKMFLLLGETPKSKHPELFTNYLTKRNLLINKITTEQIKFYE